MCDNVARCHELKIIDDTDAMRVLCTQCKHQFFIRKDPIKNVPEKRQYIKIFKKEALQGNENLFYKYYSQFLK